MIFRVMWGNIRDNTPIMENQMEKNMETGMIKGYLRVESHQLRQKARQV